MKFRVLKSKISIILLILSPVIFPQKDIKVLSSDNNSILIEFTAKFSDSAFIEIGGQSYYYADLLYGSINNPDEWGMPSVPERLVNIGVPSEYGNTIEVISSEYNDIDGLISPIPGMVNDAGLDKVDYAISENYYYYVENPELVTFGEFGITRGLNSQTIKILPVKFNPTEHKIKLYKRILFRVNYSKTRTERDEPYDELLASSVLNYKKARYWQDERNKLNKEVANSVLFEGTWIRFETGDEEGIYKIDYNFLTAAGLDPGLIDPRTIKIYNNGGKVLPEELNSVRPFDLEENAIRVIGAGDGIFNQGDFILFYGRGTNFWDYDEVQGKIRRYHHPYSEKNYYWLTYGGANGKRIEEKAGLSTPADVVQTSTMAFADNEDDYINLGKTGRQYFGDDFSTSILSRTYVSQLNGRISSQPIEYAFNFVVASEDGVTLAVAENGTNIFTQYLSGYGSSSYVVGNLHSRQTSFNNTLPDNRSVLKFSISPSSISAVGYIDYFEISYVKELKAFDDKILFFSPDTSAIVEYFLNNFSTTGIDVYDVSDYSNVKIIGNHIQLSGGDCRFRFEEIENNILKYYAVANDNYLAPVNPVAVGNSNIRGIQNGAEYIIITSDEFVAPANRLKEYRENDALIPVSTTVINIDEIYNEFSCGVVDPTAVRDFVKYAYDNWTIKPAYLLLFGKGTYDYKNTTGFDDNFVPTWQTLESLQLLNSYTSDDYFVNVDGIDTNIDLATGRLSVSNETEADNYVTKVIDYEQSSKKSKWKNLITLVADDGLTTTGNELWEHTRPTETIANDIIPESFDLNKIYLADYPPVITGSGRRKPTVNTKIINSINDGTLLINYIGHGNPEVWAHEIVFERSSTIPQLKNSEYFFLVAATCDFGYYDIPNFESAAEELVFKQNSGSIGALNSARLVYSGANHALNNLFLTKLLDSPRDTLNLLKPVGLSYFATKEERNGTNDRKYHLFADPLLRLQVPRNTGKIDSINGQPLIADIQIKALSNTSISGTILTPENEPWTDFNGEGVLTVFDSQRLKLLEQIGNEPMVIPGGIIFRGSISVVNGEFNTSFVVPKDILYENKNGKIIFYFFDDNTDGIAYTKKIIVGGTDTTTVNDGAGPEIEIYFDDATLYNAFLVGPEPKLIVKLSDETGLNTTGTGVGHKLEGILNEDESSPIDFTNYFKGELDAGGKTGEIEYNFNRLEEGEYHLKVKAWDVFNNFSSEESDFMVVSDEQLVIHDLYNYPNPFSENTTFTFQHNLATGVDVKINIYTIAGRKIKEIERKNIDQKYVRIDWNGRDEDGDRIANGTYLYKVVVKTFDGDFNQSVLGKLAVIR